MVEVRPADARPVVVLASDRATMERVVTEPELDSAARVRRVPLRGVRPTDQLGRAAAADPETDRRLIADGGRPTALIVCHGAPRITARDHGRAARACASSASWRATASRAGSTSRPPGSAASATVDTTNGSSYGVSEWALAMALIGLRNAGALVPPHRRRPPGDVLPAALRGPRVPSAASSPARRSGSSAAASSAGACSSSWSRSTARSTSTTRTCRASSPTSTT